MEEDRKKCSELMEKADILMKSVDHWNKKMDSVASEYEKLSEKNFHSLEEVKEMEALEEEIDSLSRRLDLEYNAISEMENEIEKQIAFNSKKKDSIKNKINPPDNKGDKS
jgi:predicted RNase H-like nuclease (RuvC/YqgF family)